MANVKRIAISTAEGTALTVYAIIKRISDGYLLDDSDGSFADGPADPYLSLSEDSVIKGNYSVDESRVSWSDGEYEITAYMQDGGSPAPATDTVIGSGQMFIRSDEEVDISSPLDVGYLNGSSVSAEVLEGVFTEKRVVVDGGVIEIVQGDNTLFQIVTTRDLTGKKVYFSMTTERDGTPDLFDSEATITQANPGIAESRIDGTASASVQQVWGEFQVRESDDTQPEALAQFKIIIIPRSRI